MICPYPIRLANDREDLKNASIHDKIVPCGKCSACRHNYAQDWIFRLKWENKQPGHISSGFWTFTYSDENLSYEVFDKDTGEITHTTTKPTLVPDDLQRLWKRIRRWHSYRNMDFKLRYYSVGEYGGMFERPHFHAIIWNLHPKFYRKNHPWEGEHRSTLMESIWKNGMCQFIPISDKNIAYVSQFHLLPNDRFDKDGRYKEHATMSTKPYLGKYYVDANKQAHLKNENMYVRTSAGLKRRMPKIYKEKIWNKELLKPADNLMNIPYRHDIENFKFHSFKTRLRPDKQKLKQLREGMYDEIHRDYLAELERLERKGFKDPHAEYNQRLINKAKIRQKHAEEKKGRF